MTSTASDCCGKINGVLRKLDADPGDAGGVRTALVVAAAVDDDNDEDDEDESEEDGGAGDGG